MSSCPLPGTSLTLHQVPSASDNLIWLLSDTTGATYAVDGPTSTEVDAYCSREQLRLVGILNTHVHADHIGINVALQKEGRLKDLRVVGARKTAEAVPGLTDPVEDGDVIDVLGTQVEVMLTEGHLDGHISFVIGGAVFCGDTLFAGGCGYLFDGPPSAMHASLQKIAALPDETLVCCAHEYTEDNLRFAWWLEADTPALDARIQEVGALRSEKRSTLPSTIGLEKTTNPFLRVFEEGMVEQCVSKSGEVVQFGEETFAGLRALKDRGVYRKSPRPGYPAD